MAVFGPYTQPVKPAEWVDPLDLNLYAKGTMYKQQLAEQNLQNISDTYNNLFSRNVYGADKRKLGELEQQFKQELSGLNLNNLGDMSTVSQIRNLIGKYSNNPEASAGIQRGALWDSETERRKKAEEKGESYTSPILDTLGKYFSQDEFYEKPKGLNLTSGWISPKKDIQEAMKQAREAVKKKVLNTKTGVVEEVIDPIEARNYFMELTSAIPSYKKDISYNFEKETEEIDWATEGNNYIKEKLEEKRAAINQARLYGDKEAELLATRELNRLEKMADPLLVGDELRNQYQNSWFQNEMDKVGYSMDMVSFVDYKRDPVYMENLRSSNNRAEKLYGEIVSAGYNPSTGKPIMVGDQSLANIKQAEKAKEEKAKSLTQTEKDRKIITDAIIEKGAVTQDQISQLAERGEIVVYDPNTETVNISYGKYWDPETQTILLPDKKPILNLPVRDFIRNRTGVEIDQGAADTPPKEPVKITRPQ
jgi:hypothetical protein